MLHLLFFLSSIISSTYIRATKMEQKRENASFLEQAQYLHALISEHEDAELESEIEEEERQLQKRAEIEAEELAQLEAELAVLEEEEEKETAPEEIDMKQTQIDLPPAFKKVEKPTLEAIQEVFKGAAKPTITAIEIVPAPTVESNSTELTLLSAITLLNEKLITDKDAVLGHLSDLASTNLNILSAMALEAAQVSYQRSVESIVSQMHDGAVSFEDIAAQLGFTVQPIAKRVVEPVAVVEPNPQFVVSPSTAPQPRLRSRASGEALKRETLFLTNLAKLKTPSKEADRLFNEKFGKPLTKSRYYKLVKKYNPKK